MPAGLGAGAAFALGLAAGYRLPGAGVYHADANTLPSPADVTLILKHMNLHADEGGMPMKKQGSGESHNISQTLLGSMSALSFELALKPR